MNAVKSRLTSCTDCGREVSLRAAACPHCGAPVVPVARPEPKNTWMAVAVAVLLGTLIFGPVLYFVFADNGGASAEPPKSIEARQDEAVRMAEQFVEKNLEPKPAKFPEADSKEVQSILDEGGVWRVFGSVDTVNAFNAPTRRRWTAKVKFVGGDNWRLVELQMGAGN
jgi:DNA-directed RNA polymerase subunit RPC12/RpoP